MSPVSILKVVVLPAPLIPSSPKHWRTQREASVYRLFKHGGAVYRARAAALAFSRSRTLYLAVRKHDSR